MKTFDIKKLFCFLGIFILVIFHNFSPSIVFSDNINVNVVVDIFDCGDGIDNDSDTLIDFPDDPGCESPNDSSELDIYACQDGIDNDSDSLIDFPDDPGCGSITDDDEYNAEIISSGGGGGGGGGSSSSGDASVILTGRAYPREKVFILRDGKQHAQSIAGLDGNFSIKIDKLKDKLYNFSVYGEDKNGLKSDTFSFPVELSSGSETRISGIFLPPTFSSDKEVVRRGDPIVFFGQSAPEADIIVRVNSETEIFLNEFTDENGVFFSSLDSSRLEVGDHEATSRFQKGIEYSEFGALLDFEVSDFNKYRDREQSKYLRGDVNYDNRVNLIDFSIAAYWYKKSLDSNFIEVDSNVLNGDGVINLVDFSIMASNWTG